MLETVNNTIPYAHPHTGKAEAGRNQAVNAGGKVKDAQEEQPNPLTDDRDEYIRGDETTEKSPGIYRLEKDENGNPKIVFDRPDSGEKGQSAELTQETQQSNHSPESAKKPNEDDAAPEKPEKENEPEKPGDKEGGLRCAVNTDRVDREIKQLKEKSRELEQQIRQAHGDEEKSEDLKRQLTQIASELRAKDNDAYRKAKATVTYASE